MSPGTWHHLKLRFRGYVVQVEIDGDRVAEKVTRGHHRGLAALGCGFHHAQFDNLRVQPFAGPEPKQPRITNLALQKTVTASSHFHTWSHDFRFVPAHVNDWDPTTGWSAAEDDATGAWIQIDLEEPTRLNAPRVVPYEDRITAYKIQYWEGNNWKDAYVGRRLGEKPRQDRFATVTTTRIRLLILETNGEPPVIAEFELYDNE